MTQELIVLNHLKEVRMHDLDGGWVMSYDLTKVNTNYGWLGTCSRRRCNDLVERGDIERMQEGKYAKYRYNFPPGVLETLRRHEPQLTIGFTRLQTVER